MKGNDANGPEPEGEDEPSALPYAPLDPSARVREPKYYVTAGYVLGVWFVVHLLFLLVLRSQQVRGSISGPEALLIGSTLLGAVFAGATVWDALTDREPSAAVLPQVILAWFALGLAGLSVVLMVF